MEIIRFENPHLSFKPKILFVEKQDEVNYKIFADGLKIGLILERNGYWLVNSNEALLPIRQGIFNRCCKDALVYSVSSTSL